MRSHSGRTATSISHPIATYSAVDATRLCSLPVAVSATPAAASVQNVQRSAQPQAPRSTPRVNGV